MPNATSPFVFASTFRGAVHIILEKRQNSLKIHWKNGKKWQNQLGKTAKHDYICKNI